MKTIVSEQDEVLRVSDTRAAELVSEGWIYLSKWREKNDKRIKRQIKQRIKNLKLELKDIV